MRAKLNKNVVRNGTLTFRINMNQEQYLQEAQNAVEQSTGFVVSKAWVVLKLMEHGLDNFERQFGLKKSKKSHITWSPPKKKSA